MAEVTDVGITDGVPDSGTGTVPTLSKTNTAIAAVNASVDSTNTLVGAVNESAPATDTAASGLNGRLARVAQRLTSMIALLPTALGAGGGIKVDGSGTALPISDDSGSLTVDNGGTFAVQATVAAGATNIAKAEDAASANADVGVPAMAVRAASPANTSGANGDYEFLQMLDGRLWTSATIDTALPVGTNAIGKLAANSGVDIGDVDVTSVIPGTGATNLGKAEDAVHSSGDTGVMALAVRDDAGAAALAADGDYVPLTVNSTGALYVTGGGGGTEYTEDAAAAANPVGHVLIGVRRDTLSAVEVSADGDNIAIKATDKGKLHVAAQLMVGDSAIATGSNAMGATVPTVCLATDSPGIISTVAHDAVDAGDPIKLGGYAKAAAPTDVSADADRVNAWFQRNGALSVGITAAGALIGGDATNGLKVDVTRGVVGGDLAHDAADSTSLPFKIGAKATASVSGATMVSAADRTNLFAGVDGVLIVRNHCNLEDIVVGSASNTDGTSTETIAAAGSGIKQYVTHATFSNTSAAGVMVALKSGSTSKWRGYLPATGGREVQFDPPLPPNAANEAWNFDPDAATTTVECSLVGFKSKV